jgi:acyl transferase domain-containing protein/aryl carrier-like protein
LSAEDERLLDYLKKVTIELRDTRARLGEVERRAHEPIAIVGIGCRYPGYVRSAEQLWELVVNEGDAISGFPSDRGWDLESVYDPHGATPGTSYTDQGGFLYDVADFDAAFFGIGPREALAMDPQQRLLLEVVWEAIENAGIDPSTLKDSQTGVFAGVANQEHGMQLMGASLPEDLRAYLGMGSTGSVLSGRISYVLGLGGPAITLDTACSSSLVALHLACDSLRKEDCTMAIAGGVTVMCTPMVFVGLSSQRGLAADGRCKSFAEGADGTGFSEGAGVMLLERLADAHRLKHPVLGLIAGSGINQDGTSNGLSAPNGLAQERVIRQALRNAGLDAAQIDAVEAHGTGTMLGDPIEAEALLGAYGRDRPSDRPLWLGSIKSNIGHAQAAAGVAGVIKMVMAMRNSLLPRTLHVDRPTSKVDWSLGDVRLLGDPVSWTRNGRPRRAGVSSFGISGTNAHLIVEEAPPLELDAGRSKGVVISSEKPDDAPVSVVGVPASMDGDRPVQWVVSGRSEAALRAQAESLRSHLAGEPGFDIADVAFSLASGRSAFESRAVVLGTRPEELLDGLATLAAGSVEETVVEGVAPREGRGVAFLFTGQGAQRVGMGRELYEAIPDFKAYLDEVFDGFEGLLEHSLRSAVFDGAESGREALYARTESPDERGSDSSSLLDQTAFTQAGLFALEVALFRLLQGWGVRPDYLLGHSIGELAAAHVAGMMSLEDACRLVAARGRLMGALPQGGIMVALRASEQEVRETLEDVDRQVAVAAVNGPNAVVISGDEEAVAQVAELWSGRGRKTRRLQVGHAFHSPRMDGMLDAFASVVDELSFAEPAIPVISNLTGEPLSSERARDPRYWVDHVRGTVRFADGVRWLADHGVDCFLELGPDGVLSAVCAECLAELPAGDRLLEGEGPQGANGASSGFSPGVDAVTAVPALRAGRPEMSALARALAQLWVRGVEVDWATTLRHRGPRRVDLPTYAFQRERYWLDEHATEGRDGEQGAPTAGQSAVPERPPVAGESALLELAWTPSIATPIRRGSNPQDLGLLTLDESGWLELAMLSAGVAHRPAYKGFQALCTALRTGASLPDTVLVGFPEGEADVALPQNVHAGAARMLELIQSWLAEELLSRCRLLTVTRGAVTCRPRENVPGLVSAPLWGLLRSAQAENPGRLAIIDVDGEHASWSVLGCAVALMADEPQLAVRKGMILAPRLTPLSRHEPVVGPAGASMFDSHGTTLITGGTGYLGALVARHLVSEWGVRNLLLTSRHGERATGAARLRSELSGLGASVEIVACDASDRVQLARLLDEIPDRAPLRAVIHSAGVVGKGIVETLGVDRLHEALAAKVDAAWHLHELTEALDLSAFVLFSSSAGIMGSPMHGGYAAANVFLDALAQERVANGLTGLSIAWGLWDSTEGMGGEMMKAAGGRVERSGLRPIPPDEGLCMFDAACVRGDPAIVALPINVAEAGKPIEARMVPAVFRGLVRTAPRQSLPGVREPMLARLSEAPAHERGPMLLQAIREQVAAVLGGTSPEDVDPERSLLELGFESLSVIELHSRLRAVTMLPLPVSVVLERPTPAELAAYMEAALTSTSSEDTDEHALTAPEERIGSQ